MADVFDKETRSRVMSRIRRDKTKPELMLKERLRGTYLRYQPKMEGKPDFASSKRKLAVFVDGCFWHKCPKCFKEPESNTDYWVPKIEKNVERDKTVTERLKRKGWIVLRFWEHQVKANSTECADKIKNAMNKGKN